MSEFAQIVQILPSFCISISCKSLYKNISLIHICSIFRIKPSFSIRLESTSFEICVTEKAIISFICLFINKYMTYFAFCWELLYLPFPLNLHALSLFSLPLIKNSHRKSCDTWIYLFIYFNLVQILVNLHKETWLIEAK